MSLDCKLVTTAQHVDQTESYGIDTILRKEES
jgi:hypothetical protein